MPARLFVAATIAAVLSIGYLGRRVTFYHDEWVFIAHRGTWSIDSLLAPHNEHFVLVMAVAYKALLFLVGLETYLPYLAVLLGLHAATAAAVYRILANAWGRWPALGGGLLVLVLGSASENLYWAFQMGFVGATAAGAWALALLSTKQPSTVSDSLAALLLVVAVATVGTGLFFVPAVIALVLMGPRARWSRLWVVVPAVGVYAAWYLTIGRAAVAGHRDPFSFDAVADIPAYVVTGSASALGQILGLGPIVGMVGVVVAVGWILGRVLLRAPLEPIVVAGLIGLLAQFALTGLVRAHLGLEQATASRYVYTAAVFILCMVPGLRAGAPRPVRVVAPIAATALLAIAITSNAGALVTGNDYFVTQARQTRALASVVPRVEPRSVDLQRLVVPRGWVGPIGTIGEVQSLITRYGSPVDDGILRGIIVPPTARELEDATFLVIAGGLRPTEIPPPADPAAPRVAGGHAVTYATDGCLRLESEGPDPWVHLIVPSGGSVALLSPAPGTFQVFAAANGPFTEGSSVLERLRGGVWYRLELPHIVGVAEWQVRIDPPDQPRPVTLCVDG